MGISHRRRLYLIFKRAGDVTVSAALLLLSAPVLLVIAGVVRISSPGPALYRGVRSGRYGKPFRVLKFRTMRADAEALGGPSTGLRDSRVTQVGHFLRRYKLDELPQLWNVLRGQMSLVGPRPEVPRYTDWYEGEEREILSIRPGITDFASLEFASLDEVLGAEDPDHVYETQVRPVKNQLRVRYVREMGLRTDLKILVDTVRVLLRKCFLG